MIYLITLVPEWGVRYLIADVGRRGRYLIRNRLVSGRVWLGCDYKQIILHEIKRLEQVCHVYSLLNFLVSIGI